MKPNLSELLVSLALGGLVIAGAMQMHTAFTRQGQRLKEVAEQQQTLRVSMRLLEAAVHNAGAGGRVVENDEGQCAGGPRAHPTLDWANGVLRLLGARAAGPLLASGEGGGELHLLAGEARGLGEGDLFQVLTPDGPCTREVSAGPAREGTLAHDPARSSHCFNPAPATDRCLQRCTTQRPCPLRRLAGVTEFRLHGGRLQMRQARLGDETAPWTVVADRVEDFQVGFVCESGACDASSAGALRITLKAGGRSLTEVIALRNVS